MHSLIIFDLDGTLIDSAQDLTHAINAMLEQFGKPPAPLELVKQWVGNGSVTLVERTLDWAKVPLEQLEIAHQSFLVSYGACQHEVMTYEGVETGLAYLQQQGFLLALCTNKPQVFLPSILNQLGWHNRFDCVVGGDTLPTKKPNPAGLWHICQVLGVHPSQAVMVGDSVNDIKAGQQAGMMTLALSYGYNYGLPIQDSHPDRVFDGFDDLVAFLLEHNSKTPKKVIK